MKDATSRHYLKKAERFFATFNLSEENQTPQAICDALQRAARDKDDLHRADGDINDKKVSQAIQKFGYAKSSWQQLKTAVLYYYDYHGDDNAIRAIKQTGMGLNLGEYRKPPKKIKTISPLQVTQIGIEIQAQFQRLQIKPKNWDKLNQQAQDEWKQKREVAIIKFGGLASLITLFHTTGCRPIEAMSMKALGNNVIFIKGAKHTKEMHNGSTRKDGGEGKHTRGANRFIVLPKVDYQKVEEALVTLKNIGWLQPKTDDIIEQAIIASGYNHSLFFELDKDEQEEIVDHYRAKKFQTFLDLAQSQFRRISKKVLRPKKSLCFYTFRHQLASDLKADDSYSRTEIAYLLGHLATKSLDSYGYKRSGKSKRNIEVADINALKRIRTTHTTIEFNTIARNDQIRKRHNLFLRNKH